MFDVREEKWVAKITPQGMANIVKADDKDFQIGYAIVDERNRLAREEDIVRAKLIAASPELFAVIVEIADLRMSGSTDGSWKQLFLKAEKLAEEAKYKMAGELQATTKGD